MQEKSSQLVTDLEAAHGVVLGKTRMHELAEGYTSISAFYGPVLNPYRVDAHVGGQQILHTQPNLQCAQTPQAHP